MTISFASQLSTLSLRKSFLPVLLCLLAISAVAQDLSLNNASVKDAEVKQIDFDLHVNPKFQACLGKNGQTPTAHVTIKRGNFADTLTIQGENFRPKLAFDMFTVQRSNLLSNGSADPNFTTFGLAWYQSDLEANKNGEFKATIKTVLLDQIFGFNPDVTLPPTQTLHVGFWFNDPNDANEDGCTFDITHPTPFNGEHKAGPVAMISVPDGTTNLGPLCTNPNTQTQPASCNP